MAEVSPHETLGALLLRPEGNPNSREVRDRYARLKRFLDGVLEHHCGAIEFGKRGDAHIHLAFAARVDIETGFCKTSYTQYTHGISGAIASLMEPAEARYWLRQLPNMFTPNAELENLRSVLNSRIGSYGFKRIRVQDIAPLTKDPPAFADYVTKQLYIPSGTFLRYAKPTQMIIRPESVPRKYYGRFSWIRGKGAAHRKKIKTIAQYLEITDLEGIEGLEKRLGETEWRKKVYRMIGSIQKQSPLWPDYITLGHDPMGLCRRWARSFDDWYDPEAFPPSESDLAAELRRRADEKH